MLADIDGNLIFLLIMAIIGVINWLTNKKSEETPPQNTPQRKSASPTSSRPQRPANSEEERMRKFLEALGIPADHAPPPVKPRETPSGPPRPLPKLEPKPPFVAGHPLPLPRSKPRPVAPVPPPLPAREEVSQDHRPAPSLPVEQLHIPTLKTPDVPEFVTTASKVSAIPTEKLIAQESDAYSIAPELSSRGASEGIRALLATPASLRNAVLLREVLGPPRGLQSTTSLPTFP